MLKYLKKILLGTEIPVWFVLVSAIVASFATYWIAPNLNEKFEANRIRSEIVLNRVDEINHSTRKLFSDIQKVYDFKNETGNIDRSLIIETLPTFASLQWRAIELNQLAGDNLTEKLTKNYQISLLDLKNSLEQVREPKDLDLVTDKLKVFANASFDLNTVSYKIYN